MKTYAGWLRGLFAGVASAAVLTPLWLLTPPTLLGSLVRAVSLAGVICLAGAWAGRRRPSIGIFLVLGALISLAFVAEWQNPGWFGRNPLGTRPIEHVVAVATAAAAVVAVVVLWRGRVGGRARLR